MNRLEKRVGLVFGSGTLGILFAAGHGRLLLAGFTLGDVLLGLESGNATGSWDFV